LINYLKILSIFILLKKISFCNDIHVELNIIDSLSERGIHHESFARTKKLYNQYPDNIDAICRMAGSIFIKAQNEDNLKKKKDFFYRGFDYAKEALKSDSLHGYANFWYAAYIGRIGQIEGNREAILNSYHVKKYGLKAIELISEDYDPAYHMMGRWHYELADLSEFERIIASLIYKKPPQGSYDEAEKFFSTAVKMKPEEIRNHYWLGKTYLATGNLMLAEKEFETVILLKPRDMDDRRMQKKAQSLLN